MRWFVVLILLSGSAYPQYHYDELRNEAISFDKHWNRYIRELFGCNLSGEVTVQSCHLESANVDYTEYDKARKEAIKLFDLRDK